MKGDPTGFQPDGSYVLTQTEFQQDCDGLTETLNWHLDQIKGYARSEEKASKTMPKSLFALGARLVGYRAASSTHGGDFRREVRVVVAMNAALAVKGCATVDIAAAIGEEAELFGEEIPTAQ